ncbi:MAG: tetratricopeptide repeat protein [Myxococcales bacterium]|nr:tetratricopeptide repeat protein [Myxococcales bacterium]
MSNSENLTGIEDASTDNLVTESAPSRPSPDPEKLRELDEAAAKFEGQKRWQDLIRTLQAKGDLVVDGEARVAILERVASIYIERFSNQAEALKAHEAILEVDGGNARSLEFVKAMYEKRREWEKLLTILRREAAAAPASAQFEQYLSIARFVAEKVKKPELSIEAWEEVFRRDSEHPEALTQLSSLYEKSKEFEKLGPVLRAQAAQTSDTAAKIALLVKLGLIASDKLNDDGLAVEAWRGVLALDPNDRRAQEALKKRYLAMHAWDDLETFYADSGKWDELIRILEREAEATALDTPAKVSLLSKIAELWEVRKEKVDRAARNLEKVLELDPQNRNAALRLAPMYEGARDAKKLASVLEVKLQGDAAGAESLETLRRLGGLYETQLSDAARAFACYRQAFALDPLGDGSAADLIRSANATASWPEVVASLEAALAQIIEENTASDEAIAMLRLRLGDVLAGHLNAVDPAAAQYRAILERDPRQPDALMALEGLLRSNARWPELLEVLDARLANAEAGEERRAVLFEIVRVAEEDLKDGVRAVEAANLILTEFGDDAAALAALDRLYAAGEAWESLAEILQRELDLADLNGEAEAALTFKFRLAEVLAGKLGRVDAALGLYRDILATDVEHAAARASLEGLLQDETWRGEAASILLPVYELREDWESVVRALEILAAAEKDTAARVELLERIGSVHATLLNQPERALNAYGRAFRDDPSNGALTETLLGAAEAVGGWPEVSVLFRAGALKHEGTELGRSLWLRVAEVEGTRRNNLEAAVAALEHLLAQDPSDLDALAALENSFVAAGRWQDALSVMRRRFEQLTDPDAQRGVLAQIAETHDARLQDPESAIATWREMLGRDPTDQEALASLDRIFGRLGRWQDLAENLNVRLGLAESPEEEDQLRLRLARVYAEHLGDRGAAIELYRAVLSRDVTNDEAVAALEAMLAAPEHTAAVVDVLEPVYRERGAYEALVRAYEVLVGVTQDAAARVELLHRVAEVQEVALDNPADAFATLARALIDDPSKEETLEGLDRLARTLEKPGDFVAVLDARIAAVEDPEVWILLNRRAAQVAEEQLSDVERAIAYHAAILGRQPHDIEAINALERLYQLADRAADLSSVLVRKSEAVDDVDERKQLLWRAAEIDETVLNNADSAVSTYARLAAVDDTDVAPLDALIRLFIAGQKWPELLGVYEKKADLLSDPDEKKRLYFEIAAVHESELNDGTKAVDAYNRALELDPTDLIAIQRLDQLYSAQGRWQELLGILEREAELAADPNEVAAYRFRVAELHEKRLGQVGRAVEIYKEILESIPDHQPSIDALSAIVRGDVEALAAAAVLEPVFEAAGAYDRVVEVLEITVAHSEDALRKIELLTRIAAIQESMLDNAAGAFDAYRRAFALDPNNDEVLGHLERLAEGLERWGAVTESLDAAVPALGEDVSRKIDLLQRAGQIFESQLGDGDNAVARYTQALELDPENGVSLRALDRLYEALERWGDMAAVLRREVNLTDMTPDEALEVRFRLAQVLQHRLGDVDGALGVYREILDAQGDHEATVAALDDLFTRDVRRAEISAILEPIYQMGESWDRLVDLKARTLDLITEAPARVERMREIAEISEERLGDAPGAFDWLGRAVRELPLDERSLAEVERLAAVTDAWADLTNVYADVVEAETAPEDVRRVIGKRLARVHEEELGNVEAAEGAYAFVLDVAPLDADALEALDRIYSASADAARLAPIVERRAQIAEDPETKTEFTFRLAQLTQNELEQPEASIRWYRAIVDEIDPRHRPSLDALAALYESLEKWPELSAIEQRRLEVAESDDEQAELYTRLAVIAERYLAQPDEAVKLYERVLVIRGEETDTLGALAALHESAGRWAELIDILERQLASENDPDQRTAVALRIAEVYLHRLNDTERAIEGYRRALDLDPACFDALRALATIYRNGQRWEELVSTLQTLIQLGSATLPDEELKGAYTELGQVFWGTLQQGWEAVDAWRHVLELDAGDMTAIEALLVIHAAQDEWRDVVEVLERKAGLVEAPEEKIALYLQIAGVWAERLEDRDGGRSAYEKIVEIDPLHEEAFKALEELHTAAERWDDLGTLYIARHDALAEREATREAVPWMVAAARVYGERLGDSEQAFAAAQIAFEEDVDNDDAVKVLEGLAASAGKWNELLKGAVESYQSEPAGARKTSLGLHVARWYAELGRHEYAAPIYEQITKSEPNNLKAQREYANLHRKLGQWQQVAKRLQRASEISRTPDERRRSHLDLGEVYEKQLNALPQAIEQYDAALALDPRDLGALEALARVFRTQEEWGRLVDTQRRAVDAATEDGQRIALRLQIGETLEDRVGDQAAAAEEYNAILATDDAHLPALRGLERVYAALGQSQNLLRVLERQLDVAETERERIKLLSRIAEMQEVEFLKPELAIARDEQVLEIDPNHDGALRGLERLYRQTARWNDLIGTYERHLTATVERNERVPLYLAMGRVYAEELRDNDHAEDAFLNVLQIDEHNVQALELLARLYEQREDWHRALDMLEQLSQLLASDRARAVELRHRVGRIAEEQLQDEGRASDLYQSCLDLDDGYVPALQSLRRLAERQADWHLVSRYLDREQQVTEQPRQRARLLAELGRINAEYLDDLGMATSCWQEALKNDADNEEAAWPLARVYVADSHWAEAEPLLDVLVRRASRRDPAEQLEIQLTAGRVAQSLAKTDKAIKAFTAAQALDRSNVESIRSLANAYFEKKDWENAFKNYQVLLVHHKDDLPAEERAELYQRLGVVKREQGDRKRAVNFLEKSLEEVPGYAPALHALIETYEGSGEWEQVIAYKTQVLDNEFDDEKRYAMFVEIANLWQERVKNPHKAIQALAAAVEIHPNERPLLTRLTQLYQETRQWSKLIEVVERLIELETNAATKARFEYTIATLYNSEIKNVDEALVHYNKALDNNPDELKPFAKINEILTSRRDFKNLERNFRKMLHRVANKGKTDLEFNLLHNLGIIYRDRLGQADAAIKSFEMAAERKPDDIQEQRILAELHTASNQPDAAVSRWRLILDKDFGNADALHAIYDLYYGQRQYDRAWCVAATATFLLRERARDDLRAFYEQYKPRNPYKPSNRMTEEQWVKELFHPNEDPVLGKIFASILGALRRAKVQPIARFGFTQADQHDPRTSTLTLVKVLGNTANYLSLPTPLMFLRQGQPGGLAYVPSDPIASFSGQGLLSGFTQHELTFAAAKHLSYYRNEHYVRVLFPTVQELTAILLGAIKVVKPDQQVPPEAEAVTTQLMPLLAQDPVATEGLRKVVRVFLDQGGASNIKKWYQSVELTAARAGFLMVGDLDVVKKMIALEPGLPGDLAANEKLKDVVNFSVSEQYFSLRDALGINFQSAAS